MDAITTNDPVQSVHSKPVLRPSRSAARSLFAAAGVLFLLFFAEPAAAQDLDPRAYAHVPVNGTFLVTGFALSHGGIVTDPALIVTDVNATVETPSLGVARSFNLFGKTAQIFGALPYSWAQASGKVLEEAKSITRAGEVRAGANHGARTRRQLDRVPVDERAGGPGVGARPERQEPGRRRRHHATHAGHRQGVEGRS
jgi:hypothetical protein